MVCKTTYRRSYRKLQNKNCYCKYFKSSFARFVFDKFVRRKPRHFKKSLLAFADELERCELLGIPYLNFHPGAHVGAGEEEGIKKIIESLNIVHDKTKKFKVLSVVEVTAGQGTTLGYKFEQIEKIINGVDDKKRMAVCIDTCHIFAAGYDFRTEKTYEKTFKEFDEIVGLKKLVAFHINDSKKSWVLALIDMNILGKGRLA